MFSFKEKDSVSVHRSGWPSSSQNGEEQVISVLRGAWENIFQSKTQSLHFVCAETCCMRCVEGWKLRCKVVSSFWKKKQLKSPMAFSISLCLSIKSVGLFPDMEGKVLLYGNQGANFQYKQSSTGRCLWKSFPSQLEPGKQYRQTE